MEIKMVYKGEWQPPKKQTDGSAGIDLFNNSSSVLIGMGETAVISTGVFVQIPDHHVGLVTVRSSVGFKHGTTLANSVGVIDSDYRGEIKVKLINHGERPFLVTKGDRVAQLLIIPCPNVTYKLVDSLDETVRGDGGFGSTGIS